MKPDSAVRREIGISPPAEREQESTPPGIHPETSGQLTTHERARDIRLQEDAESVRPDKVRRARDRIQQGYYERADVHGSLVETLLRAFRGR